MFCSVVNIRQKAYSNHSFLICKGTISVVWCFVFPFDNTNGISIASLALEREVLEDWAKSKGWLQPRGEKYRHLMDIEVSKATYNCKIGFIDFLFNYPKLPLILTITWYFDTPSIGVVHHTKSGTIDVLKSVTK